MNETNLDVQANDWDVVVIGGGSGGLSTALLLARARRRVVVLDGGAPRNRFAPHMHGVLGHDGKSPLQLLADGRREIEAYGGVILRADVAQTRRDGERFTVATSDGQTLRARRLVVATGLRDELPDVEGLAAQWGRGVAVCPYCDGYEVRDQRIGILATGPRSLHQAQLLRQWSASIVYLANDTGVPEGDDAVAFAARGIRVEEGAVRRVLTDGGRVAGVELGDGRVVELDAIFTAPRMVPLDEPLRQLGADRAEGPAGSFVAVDDTGRTSVPGVWAVGNVVNAAGNVPIAIAAGAWAAGMVNHDLVLDDVRAAVGAHTATDREPVR